MAKRKAAGSKRTRPKKTATTSSSKATKKKPAHKKKHPVDAVRISPQLKWLEPYLRRAKDKMPGLEIPRNIRPFKPPKNKIMRTLGNAYFDSRTISLATHDQMLQKQPDNTYLVYRIVKLSKRRILETFAHELAHFHYQDHNYEQDEFTKIIFKAFGLKETCFHCGGTGKIRAVID